MANISDSETMAITLPERRKKKIDQSYKQLLHSNREKIKNVARVTAAMPAVEMGKLQ